MLIEFNDSLPLVFNFPNYKIPVWDQIYDHVWYLDPTFNVSGLDKIWVWLVPAIGTRQGVKDMGFISPNLNKQLDVIFISYHEPNAEFNWQRLLAKAPHAKRVDGVTGILEAHQEAAKLSTTDMFYVVDGDAFLLEDFNFDFIPNIFDRECVYVYHSINPINRLSYGYGGVKIFPTTAVIAGKTANTDITTSIGPKLKVLEQISNVTAFNTDAFSAWRSGFRECAKLSAGIIENSNSDDNDKRLRAWQTIGHQVPYGVDAIAGARLGVIFGEKYRNNHDKMQLINNREWLKRVYDRNK